MEWRCEVMYGDKNKKPTLREVYRFLVWADKYNHQAWVHAHILAPSRHNYPSPDSADPRSNPQRLLEGESGSVGSQRWSVGSRGRRTSYDRVYFHVLE